MKLSSMPIFLEEQGTCTATLPRTRRNSSLSSRKWRMNSTGSYRLRAGVWDGVGWGVWCVRGSWVSEGDRRQGIRQGGVLGRGAMSAQRGHLAPPEPGAIQDRSTGKAGAQAAPGGTHTHTHTHTHTSPHLKRRDGSASPALIWERQGEVSQMMGSLPPSLAFSSASSSSRPFFWAACGHSGGEGGRGRKHAWSASHVQPRGWGSSRPFPWAACSHMGPT